MDRKIPEDIEYKKSISNLSAFCLAFKGEIPSLFTKIKPDIIFGLQLLATLVCIVIFIFAPFIPIVGVVVMIGYILWQIIEYYTAKGHALNSNLHTPKEDMKILFNQDTLDIMDFLRTGWCIVLAGVLFFNTKIWIGILFL